MKRDLNLIRDLMLIIEAADSGETYHHVNHRAINVSMPHVQHHLRLLVEAGFVRGVGETREGAVSVRLTWQGYEFLELIREDDVWARIRTYVTEKTHGLNVDVLKSVLSHYSMNAVTDERWRVEHTPDPPNERWGGIGSGQRSNTSQIHLREVQAPSSYVGIGARSVPLNETPEPSPTPEPRPSSPNGNVQHHTATNSRPGHVRINYRFGKHRQNGQGTASPVPPPNVMSNGNGHRTHYPRWQWDSRAQSFFEFEPLPTPPEELPLYLL